LKLRCSDEHFAYLLTSMLSVKSIMRPNINNVYRFCELKSNFYLYENQKLENKISEPSSSLASTSLAISEWTTNASQSRVSLRTDQRPPSRQKTADNIVSNAEVMIIPTNKLQLIKRNLFVTTYLTTKKEIAESQQTLKVGTKDKQQEQSKKFILKQIQLNDKNLKNMQNQLVKLNMLNHNNLMQMFNCVCINKRLYVLIEYQYNGSLSRLIFEQRIKGQPFPENIVLQWLLQILNGLQYLHSNSIIHTNLKCENILFTQNNLLKLTDFGYNYLLQKFDSNMILNNFSVEYSAPEIIYSNGDKYSFKSDIYSFGVVLCKCLTFRDYQQLLDMQDKEETIEANHSISHKNSIIKKRKNSINKIKVTETSFNDYNTVKTVTFCEGTKGESELIERKQRETPEQETPSVDYRRFLVETDITYSSKDYEYKLKMLGMDYSFNVRQTVIDMLNEKPNDRPALEEILLSLRNLVSVNFSKLTTLQPLTTHLTGRIEVFFSRDFLPSSTCNDFVSIENQSEKVRSSHLIKFIDSSNKVIDAVKIANLDEVQLMVRLKSKLINLFQNQNYLKVKYLIVYHS
jgi:serine/threonine protein kinase